MMLFLIPHVELRETFGNYSKESQSNNMEQIPSPSLIDKEISHVPESDTQLDESLFLIPPKDVPENPGNCPQSLLTSEKLGGKQSTGRHNLKGPKNRKETDSSEEKLLKILSREDDPDEHFLLSLLPSLKRMSPQQNALARIKLQEVLYEMEFCQPQRSTCTPNYHSLVSSPIQSTSSTYSGQ